MEYTIQENEIIEALNKVALEADEKKFNSDSQWTQRIKELLSDLGNSKNYQISTSGLEDKTVTEWLYDLVWYVEKEGLLEYVPLVMESEWGRKLKDIKFDFEKLLVANSEIKLMICQAKPNQLDEFQIYFEKAVQNYRDIPKGSRFLIALLDDFNTGEFIYQLVIKK